jgi:predicted site-specific integrase-resolvase
MHITLESWAENNFRPAPKIHTLRAWAKSGRIVPAPIKVGRRLMVQEHARYCPAEVPAPDVAGLSDRAARILQSA